jgi:hypothetical protein
MSFDAVSYERFWSWKAHEVTFSSTAPNQQYLLDLGTTRAARLEHGDRSVKSTIV